MKWLIELRAVVVCDSRDRLFGREFGHLVDFVVRSTMMHP